jgi:hypothetical protein
MANAHNTTKWLKGAERIIRIAKQEQKKQPRESATLEKFLSIQASTGQHPDHGHPELENPRAFANEFAPD